MKIDTIFYQLFQTLPDILFELIGKPATEAQIYQFTSLEIKDLALLLELGLTVEEMATRLDVDIEAVRKVAEKSGDQSFPEYLE